MAETPLQEFVRQYKDVAFLVDFDGTMVDLVDDPDQVDVPIELLDDIRNIINKDGCAFAIITGRTIGRLDNFLNGIPVPAIGSHGAEQRIDEKTGIQPFIEPMPLIDRNALWHIAEKHNCFFEDKSYSLSIHLPFEDIDKDIMPEFTRALGDRAKNYTLRKVGRTYEILQKNVTKGSAIEHLMKTPPFAGRTPIYIGDDVHADESLKIVSEMGGTLMPVRHQHAAEANKGNVMLEITDVRKVLKRLAAIQ